MRNPLKVLIVEDSEDDALLLERQLGKGGFLPEVERVETQVELQNALNSKSWDVIITDHSMPNFNSIAAISSVRSAGLDIPVIIVSGSIGEEIAVAAIKGGANDYIMKDNLARLVPAIERELRDVETRRAHKLAEATIRHMAYHDSLTGLTNRHQFESNLQLALERAKKQNLTHVLLYMDLDQFKIVNDTCGHVAGDELLRQLSHLLQSLIRESDSLARLGGDEFGVLLENCPLDRGQRIAENLLKEVKKFRFTWQNKTFSLGVSIGFVVISKEDDNINDLLSAADMACYTAKDKGRNRTHIYRKDDKDLMQREGEMHWVGRINHAIEENHLVLHQQSIIPINGASVVGGHCELLLRMKDGAGGLVPPGAFIPAAERYDLMPQIDRWVIDAALKHVGGMRHNSIAYDDQQIFFINLSGASLNDGELFTFIRQRIDRYGVPSDRICFEITETAAIFNLKSTVQFIKGIREQGCHFALDDFGTGMSSFSYLKEIPIDYLKIDGSFVKDMVDDPMDRAIVSAINDIGHVAGVKTIAEFVESRDIENELDTLGVDFAQGFSIDKPKPLQSITHVSQAS